MHEGSAAQHIEEPTVALPCGKEIPHADSKELARKIYLEAVKFSLQLSRKDRWKIIRIMTDTGLTAEEMCRDVFESELSFGGKSLCRKVCPLEQTW